MYRLFFLGIFIMFLMFCKPCRGEVIRVPAEASTIQAAIDIARNGDTVLVDEGTYYENIKFKGKSIVVASKFILDHHPDHILNTIINGSQATNLDSASCVTFFGEDSNAVLQGFTLTEGKGTIYTLSDLKTTTKYDGKITQEGGGIFFNESYATVKNNLIINNQAQGRDGFDFNGGGGISTFCGNPRICNNVIMNNRAISSNGTYGYAAALVFNESHGIIRNNIFYNNRTNGRGTVFIDINMDAIIENNTIVANICERDAAGIFNRTPKSVYRNNIVWGNIDAADQIKGISSSNVFEYCITDQNFTGKPTIFNTYPGFSDSCFIPETDAPCVDAGNPEDIFNETEDNSNPGCALPPSLGSLRNDIGAYGGPYADILPSFYNENVRIPEELIFPESKVNEQVTKEITISNLGTISLYIDSITSNDNHILIENYADTLKPLQKAAITLIWKPTHAGIMKDTLKIFHKLKNAENPLIIKISGTTQNVSNLGNQVDDYTLKQYSLQQNFPNPFNPRTVINYQLPKSSNVKLNIYDMSGKRVARLVDKKQAAGKYQVSFNATDLASGVYLYHLQAGSYSKIMKMILLK